VAPLEVKNLSLKDIVDHSDLNASIDEGWINSEGFIIHNFSQGICQRFPKIRRGILLTKQGVCALLGN
jgi:hypothetical protein